MIYYYNIGDTLLQGFQHVIEERRKKRKSLKTVRKYTVLVVTTVEVVLHQRMVSYMPDNPVEGTLKQEGTT